jgi:hypothetical protein
MPRGTVRRESPQDTLAEIQRSVDALLRENRELKRELARLERSGGTSPLEARSLRSLQRRLERAAPTAPSAAPRRRQPSRKVTDPEVLAKRRAALEKARAARAAKRAAAR